MLNKLLRNIKNNIGISEIIHVSVIGSILGLFFIIYSTTIIVSFFITSVALVLDYIFLTKRSIK